MASPLRKLGLSILALLAISCRDAATAALIEVDSDLGAELTRVEVVVRDRDDRAQLDQFSFDAAVSERYQVPFSFTLEPRTQSDQELVVTASGYGRSELLSEAKLRLALARGKTTRLGLRLWAACRGVPACPSGQACDPARAQCADIPSASSVEPVTGEAGEWAAGGAGAPAAQGGAGASAARGGAGGHAGQGGEAGEAGAAQGGAGGPGSAGKSAAGRAASGGVGGSTGEGGRGGSPSDAGRAGSMAGGPAADGGAGSGELSGKSTAAVSYQGQGYIVEANVYDTSGATLSLSYQGTSFRITSVTGSNPSGVAFPSVFIGSQYQRASAGTNLPRRADGIESIPVSLGSNAGAVSGTYQLVSALWLSAGPAFDTGLPTGGYLEVWHYVSTPHDPPGSKLASALSITGQPGSYDVWQGTCNDRPCIAYVRRDPATSFSGDLAAFLRDALARPNGLAGGFYVNGVYAGFDIAAGGAGLQLQNVSAAVR